MDRRWIAAFAAMAWTLTLFSAGCGEKQAKWTKEAAQHAVYATQIPLYPGAKVTEVMGSHSYGNSLSDLVSEGMTWWFETKATQEELTAWYTERLEGATREDTEDGDIVLTLAPPEGEEGEDMGVFIQEGGVFRVFEHTNPGKHPAD
jgi:hypothetical protein